MSRWAQKATPAQRRARAPRMAHPKYPSLSGPIPERPRLPLSSGLKGVTRGSRIGTPDLRSDYNHKGAIASFFSGFCVDVMGINLTSIRVK